MAAIHNFERKIEIRLNRSEVTNYLSSIDWTPAHDGTVSIKEEPRTEDYFPITIKAEPLHSPDSEVGVQMKGFQCPTCQLTFKYRLHLRHHQNTNIRCAVQCNPTNDVKLDQHCKTEDTSTHTSNSNAQLKNSCPKCQKEFSRSSNLSRHMAVHDENRHKRLPYVCSTCRQGFKHEINFKCHTQKKHSFKCEHCQLAFPDKSGLDGHTTTLHRDKITIMSHGVGIKGDKRGTGVSRSMLPCPECKKEFANFGNLHRHMKYIHSNESPYVCSTCRQAFKSPYYRDIHARKEHRFQCVNCELAFVHKPSLDEHGIKDHQAMSRKSFSCPECTKGFERSEHLREHMKVHYNERPYICTTCLYAFKHEKNLISHTQKNHGLKCEKCTLLFVCQIHLTQHLSQHDVKKEVT